MIKYKSIILLCLLLTTYSHAGGTYFPINIISINTISKKEHHIIFTLHEKVGFDTYSYPLDDCQKVTLKIKYEEWEWEDKIFLFLKNLFSLNGEIGQLNNTIKDLKEKTNDKTQKFVLSDVEAFHYHPDNHCEIISKTLKSQNSETFLSDQKTHQVILIQPYRQYSRIENKPKD